MAPAYSVGTTKIKVAMTKTGELAIEFYKKKTAITKIVVTIGASVNRVYGILSEHDTLLHSGQKVFRCTTALDTEIEKLL